MADEGAVREIGERFAQAALRPDLWMGAIEAMAGATGSERGELVGFGPKGRLFNWVSVTDERVIADFLSFDHSNPRVNFRIGAAARARPLEVVHEAHYDAVIPTLISDDYLRFCRTWDMLHGCQSTILAGEDSLIGLSILRTERDGRTSPGQRKIFGGLVPHVLAAVRMQSAIENQGFQLLTGAMHAMGAAAFALDGRGVVRGLSPSAEALVEKGDRLQLVRGRLRGRVHADDLNLHAMIEAALAPDRPSHPQTVAVLRAATKGVDPLILDILPLPEAPWSMGYQPRAVVVARGGHAVGQVAPLLMDIFRLTEAEAAIASLLARGVSRETIAAERGVTLVTVRTQIRNIFRKLGVTREAELVARINAL